jgi:PAS domain S-box-containing protein
MSRSTSPDSGKSLPPELAAVVFDAVPSLIWVLDVEGRIVHLNRACETETGYSSNEVAGCHLWDLFVAEDEIAAFREAFGHSVTEPVPTRMEFNWLAKDGRQKRVDWLTTAVLDGNARVQYIIGVGTVITDRAQTAEGLAENETLHQVLVESMTDGLVVDDREGRLIYVNDQFCRMVAYSRKELLGHHLSEFLNPANRSILEEQNRKRAAGAIEPYELSMIRRDGTVIDVLISPQRYEDAAGRMTGSFGVITDLTVFKRVEKERSLLATAIEQSAEAVVITDTDGTIQYVNPAFEDITGYTRSEAVGANPRILKSGEHDHAFYRDLWESISSGQVWSGLFTNRAKDGSLYEEEASISPVRGGDGQIIAYVGVKRDVSEERRLTKKLAHSQKLEALSHLAGGIAHNFNNLLMTISGSTELLRLRLPEETRDCEEFMTIEKTVARAAEVARRLLSVTHQQELEKEVLDLHDVLSAEIEMLRRVLPESISIEYNLSSDLPAVRGDRGQVAQILVNLVVHAGASMPDGGVITITASGVTPDAFLLAAHPDAAEGSYVRLSIADTGAGMDAETRDHVFEPFSTASLDIEDSGLDLAAVYGIVKQHEGMIEVDSCPGAGSRFDIYLPATTEKPRKVESQPEGAAIGGGETILVVEDEEGVRNTQVEMLGALGYNVLAAENGRVALEVIQREGDAIDLVLSDVAMPEMGGRELLDRVREFRPEMPFVFSSGFSGGDLIERMSDKKDMYFISKPYSTARLAAIIRKALVENLS